LGVRWLVGGTAVAAVTAATLGPVDLTHGFLCLAPCLALALLVAFEHYAGEQLIVSAASRRRTGRRRPAALPMPSPHDRHRPRRGQFVAGQIGARAPPLQAMFARCP
jgi:hypothetical protein